MRVSDYFSLSISIEQEFQIRSTYFSKTYVYGHPEAYLWHSQTSNTFFYLQNFCKFGHAGAKFPKTYRQIYLKICKLITLKVPKTNMELFS